MLFVASTRPDRVTQARSCPKEGVRKVIMFQVAPLLFLVCDCVSVLQLTDYITAVVSLRDRSEGERVAEGMVVETFIV